MIKKLFFLLFVLVLFSGCQPVIVDEKSCKIDSDCSCGVHIKTGDCFFGNKEFVNSSRQCPDFCTGIAAMFEIKCVENVCKQVRVK
jgi:hypothetical protein